MHDQHNVFLRMMFRRADPPGCDTFISLERLSTHSTRIPCCETGYHLHIIPEMTFTCNGNITGWTIGAMWASQPRNPLITPELQIWRNELDSGNEFSRVASVQLDPGPVPTIRTNIVGNYFRKRVFSSRLNVPISVRKGDVLGLMQSPQGQIVVHMTSFPYASLPRNYIFTSTENNFSTLLAVDLGLSAWTSIEMLQPLIALDFSKLVSLGFTHARLCEAYPISVPTYLLYHGPEAHVRGCLCLVGQARFPSECGAVVKVPSYRMAHLIDLQGRL